METSTNKSYQWQLPQRQSPAAIFIILWGFSLKLLKGFWPVLVLYLFQKESDNNTLSILSIVLIFSSLSLVGTVINYWFKKFHVTEDSLIIQSGWLKKKMLSIPFRNIQAVHLEQNVWQQALNVAKVSFDITGSEKVEVQLDALSTNKAEDLKDMLMKNVKEPADQKPGMPIQQDITYKLEFPDLMKLSLTANHLEAFLILLVVGLNVLEEIKQIFDFNSQAYIHFYAREIISQTAYMAGALFLGIAIISVLFSFARTLTKFFGFTLTGTSKNWKITFGLFNRQQKVIPLHKIQILSWRATWLRRKFDYWIMRVQAVGHNEKNRKQHVQIPVLAFPRVLKLADSYQEFTGIDSGKGYKIEPEYWKRKSLMIGLPVSLIPMIAFWYWIGWWALAFVVLFAYMTGYFYKTYQNFRWQTPEAGIQLVSGAWGRKYTLLNWKKVQQVHIHQSPYQRTHQLANVVFLTAGGKVSLPYLTLAIATKLADYVLYDVESKDENWM